MRRINQGFSLVEVLLAVVLGSIVVLAGGGVYIANKKTIGASEALGSLQNSSRIAFELMSRDLREAGSNPCSATINYSNVLPGRNSDWWSEFNNGFRGYAGSAASLGVGFGTGVGQRVAGTEAFDAHTATTGIENETLVTADMVNGTSNLRVLDASGFVSGDQLLACDPQIGFIFAASSVSATSISHATGSNCAADFNAQFEECIGGGTSYIFLKNAMVSKISSHRWYIGNNASGGRSLFRADLRNTGGSATPNIVNPVEIAPNVDTMVVSYAFPGSVGYVAAGSVSDWTQVRSVRVVLGLSKVIPETKEVLSRRSTQMITLRNKAL